MAKSHHARYDAASRYERKASRTARIRKVRRQSTRQAIVAAASQEA